MGTSPPQAEPPVKYMTPLRLAQRDLTRSRIRNAARQLFYENHFDATTMDEIAVAAGLRRATLYQHYRDKGAIVAEVIADYAPRARAALAKLPGPKPTLQQLLRWVRDVVNFTASERVPLAIILELRRAGAYGAALESLVSELLAGLGENNPSFCAAAEDSDPKLRMRGLVLLQELTYACDLYLDVADRPRGKALLEVVAEDFHAFLSRG